LPDLGGFDVRIAPLSGLGNEQTAPSTGKRRSKLAADVHRDAKRAAFAPTEAYLSDDRPPHLPSLAPHAGTGSARSRAISDRMSANICRDTATSAI